MYFLDKPSNTPTCIYTKLIFVNNTQHKVKRQVHSLSPTTHIVQIIQFSFDTIITTPPTHSVLSKAYHTQATQNKTNQMVRIKTTFVFSFRVRGSKLAH